ncbi:helix-turn-helix domain-containing protein [Capnocytophaga stomatis]|uniref:helix-turn-helix domain-containing protein n=1 Tax=Capnocytophaga stomatis TaxID=1848904 RepID=UPI00385B1655
METKKEKKEKKIHPVVDKIRKIMKHNEISQAKMAGLLGTSPSQFSKILTGDVQISVWQISNLATELNIREIDVFTYPDVYKNEISKKETDETDVKAILQIELKKEKKEQVMKLIFGDNNLEILSK